MKWKLKAKHILTCKFVIATIMFWRVGHCPQPTLGTCSTPECL